MDDLKPHTHSDEGIGSTHYACKEMTEKYGVNVECCACNNHDCTPLTEVETQKESWEEEFDRVFKSKELVLFLGKEVKELLRPFISQALLSDRARLVKMLEKQKQPLPDAIVYVPEPVDNIALQKQITLYNKGLDKAISIIKESR